MHARVSPTYGVNQGCLLSPLLFSIYLNDINGTSEGVKGVCIGTPIFHVSILLYADDLCVSYPVLRTIFRPCCTISRLVLANRYGEHQQTSGGMLQLMSQILPTSCPNTYTWTYLNMLYTAWPVFVSTLLLLGKLHGMTPFLLP
eukprot:scaffold112910_cov18-Tisochrysis_lutea.AAC.1